MKKVESIKHINVGSFYYRKLPIIENGREVHFYYMESKGMINNAEGEDLIFFTAKLFDSSFGYLRDELFQQVLLERFIEKNQLFFTDISEQKKAKALLNV